MGTRIALLVLAAVSAAAGPVYAISSSDEGRRAEQDLYVIDAITGALTRIAPVMDGSHPMDMESLAFTPTLGLYGVAHGAIYEINTTSGDATEVGMTGAGLTALVYGPNGIMYGASGDQLYSVNLSTGKATLIGAGNEGSVEGLEFDSAGELYATTGGGGANSLYRIDTATGTSTRVGNQGALGFDNVEGLAFVGGIMYAFTEDGLEISVNLNSGAGTFIRNVGVAFEATTVDPPATPEPATLGLAGAALLGLFVGRRLSSARRSRAPGLRASPQRSDPAHRSGPFAWVPAEH